VVSADVVADVRRALEAVADPAKAPAMQAYMKSQVPFLGVQKQALTRALRPLLGRDLSVEQWREAALTLWDGAQHREDRYAALAILRAHVTDADEPLLRHLITTGAWWDLVDEVATKLVDPRRVDVRAWATDADLWVRRAAIISQVGAKAGTDTALLSDVIEPNLGDRTFWIAKAIGWALRDYAYADPDWVRGFVASHELAPLSRREALKHIVTTAPS
jgi:3-methyladenine DNA glycosylase AlkD